MADRFTIRVRHGLGVGAEAAHGSVTDAVAAAEGELERWSWIGGTWDAQATATFASQGAAKLAIDRLEDAGAVVEITHLADDRPDLMLSVEDEAFAESFPGIDTSDPEWRQEMGWWEDWSVKTGISGEIERVVDMRFDELQLDTIDKDDPSVLGWRWEMAWVWDPEGQADEGVTASPPDGLESRVRVGRWIWTGIRKGIERIPRPSGDHLKVAAIVAGIGGAIIDVYDLVDRRTRDRTPRADDVRRRQRIHYEQVKDRIEKERGVRKVIMRRYYERTHVHITRSRRR